MHLEIREKDGSKKYYLAHSFRVGDQVRKSRVFLGKDLSSEQVEQKRKYAEAQLEARVKQAQIIHDPFLTVLSSLELKELATLEARGELQVLHLSELDWAKFKEAFTYNTNAIEGSLLQPAEVADILRKRDWPKDKTKEEISETYGVAEAVEYIRATKEHVSIQLVKELHRIVFKNSFTYAGNFRKKDEEVVVADAFGNIVHRGAPSGWVLGLLKELIEWYDENKEKCPSLVLAAVVHNQFEAIHPFRDGNGRVGRLLLNNILLKHGLPPLNIELRNRSEYYAALQAYENEHNIRPTVELMLKEYRALKRLLS